MEDMVNTVPTRLRTRHLGRTLYCYTELPSTNRTARELAEQGAPGGTVVVADGQTAGRGRRGRHFDSPAGGGLYMSVILRPENWRGEVELLTSCAAVATAEAVESLCDVTVQIKWVNDLFVSGRKIAGILTEAGPGSQTGEPAYVVLGIGINTAVRVFPSELAGIAASLGEMAATPLSHSDLLVAVLEKLEDALFLMDSGAFLEESRRRSLLLGREVTVCTPDGGYSARAVAINDRGHLVVEWPDGSSHALSSGEVSVRL